MNILYISYLDGSRYAGPTYSVPMQIEAQSKCDNVFWYNLRKDGLKDWDKLPYYFSLRDYPTGMISRLPRPFNKPDVVIIEQFYDLIKTRIVFELLLRKIPYIIIPRGELTKSAQKRSKIKKFLANNLIMNKFAKEALAIQYLTNQEKIDSGNNWNEKNFIIPNGVNIREDNIKKSFCVQGIRCISIGRISSFHKGIDLLIFAVSSLKDELLKNNCRIDFYGPDYDKEISMLRRKIDELGLSNLIHFNEPVYDDKKIGEMLSSDLFLITSRFEGHPMALIEAMSLGLPCLVTRGSNMYDEVKQFDAGWVAENESTSIREALMQMLSDKNKFKEKGMNSLKLSKNYTWSKIAKETHERLSQLI